MKVVSLRDQALTFAVPASWREEYDVEGNGVFYEDTPNSGTLRATLITARFHSHLGPEKALDEVRRIPGSDPETAQKLSESRAIATGIERTVESGTPITLFWWFLAEAFTPDRIALATFSYTVASTDEQADSTVRDLWLLTSSIRSAEFSAPP